MKTKLPLALVGTLVMLCPRGLLADKTDQQFRHALATYEKGDLEMASQEFEKILKHKPQHGPSRFYLGRIHMQRGHDLEETGDRAGAGTEFRAALNLRPDQPYWHSGLAKLLKDQGDLEGARAECASAAALSPDDWGLVSGCGFGPGPHPGKSGDQNPGTNGGVQSKPFKVGGNVSPPRPTYKPDPPYTEEARQARLRGTLVMLLVVDSQGSVVQTTIVKPLGLGLDQSALRTVRAWKFSPGARNGVPVPVRIMVEVGFSLF